MKWMFLFLLTACTNVKLDHVEYNRLVAIKQIVAETSCTKLNLSALKHEVDAQQIYSQYRENRPEMAKASNLLKSMVDEFAVLMKGGSASFCERKLLNIDNAVTDMLRTEGSLL